MLTVQSDVRICRQKRKYQGSRTFNSSAEPFEFFPPETGNVAVRKSVWLGRGREESQPDDEHLQSIEMMLCSLADDGLMLLE